MWIWDWVQAREVSDALEQVLEIDVSLNMGAGLYDCSSNQFDALVSSGTCAHLYVYIHTEAHTDT